MKTLLKLLLTLTVIMVLLVSGGLFFLFSDEGNDILKPYLKAEIEKQIKMPIEVEKFKLRYNTVNIVLFINSAIKADVTSDFSIFTQSFKGMYKVVINNFHHKKMTFRQMDIIGEFKGVPHDVYVNGKGTALDAPLDYKLRIVNQEPQGIEASIKKIHLEELLVLAGQPALAKGVIDLEIDMPTMAEEGATGVGHLHLSKSTFDNALILKLYKFPMPKNSYVFSDIDAKLNGKLIDIVANVKSNLFTLSAKKLTLNTQTKKVQAVYAVDVKEMRILTQNQLTGAFKIAGHLEMENKNLRVTGKTSSLGGELTFDMAEKTLVSMKHLQIEKILKLVKKPSYAKGELNGKLVLEDKNMDVGTYDVKIEKGVLNEKVIQKDFNYKIPRKNRFTFLSSGKIAKQKLDGKLQLNSTLVDIELTNIKADLTKQYVDAQYNVTVPDVTKFMPPSKNAKATKVTLEGSIKKRETIVVKGSSSGLGKKLTFNYDTKSASVDAFGLIISRLMGVAGLPIYAKGTLDSKVNISNLKTLDGTFSLRSKNLTTQPRTMKKFMGKALKLKIDLITKGKIKNHKAYVTTKVKTSMLNLTMNKTVFDIKKNILNTDYHVNIADLRKLKPLINKKLYGKMNLEGNIVKGKTLKVTGTTKSLGGVIDYTLLGDLLKSKIKNVPVENILKMLGYGKSIKGKAVGTVNHNLKRKRGKINLAINDFQIAPNKMTKMLTYLLQKDPSRIIFKTTTLTADIRGDTIFYKLIAKGTRSAIEISNGKLNQVKNRHSAKIKFKYEKYTINGTISGSVSNPKIRLDTKSLLTDKVKNNVKKRVQEELDKAMKGKVGDFLKGFGI